MKWFISFITLILSTGLVAQTTAISVIDNPVVSNLEEIKEILSKRIEVVDFRFVDIDLNSLQNETSIRIVFFDVDMVLLRDKLVRRSETSFSWFAEIEEELLSIVITVSNNNILGSISSPSMSYTIETIDGTMVLVKIDQSMYPRENCSDFIDGNQIENSIQEGGPEEEDPGEFDATWDGCKLRVLIMYTPKAKNNSHLDMTDLAQQAVHQLDFAFYNSNINQEVELVFVGEAEYSESSTMKADLIGFRDKNDNIMDDVHQNREKYGADICVLILDNTTHDQKWCGKAAAMRSSSDQAFAVVHHGCILLAKSFEHEVAHFYGAQHAVGDDNDPILETDAPYAHGYKDPTGYFRTIMAYDCPGGCHRVSHFSDPNSSNGAYPYGDADSFNRRMIVENAERMMYLRRIGYTRNIIDSDVNVDLVKSLYSAEFMETIGSVVIQMGADYIFVAGESILMQAGFEVKEEAKFEAFVSSCGEEGSGTLDYSTVNDQFFKKIINGSQKNTVGEVHLYPNPVIDNVIIRDENFTDASGDIVIYSATGKVLVTKHDVKLNGSISVTHLPEGVYFLKCSSNNYGIKVFKFIKN